MTFDRYLLIPFRSQGRDHSGCDCWGLLRLIYQEALGIELTSFEDTPATSLRDVVRLVARHKGEWVKVDAPRRFDALVMASVGRETPGMAAHVGMAVDGQRFIHTERLNGPRISRFDDPFSVRRIMEIRRHVSLA